MDQIAERLREIVTQHSSVKPDVLTEYTDLYADFLVTGDDRLVVVWDNCHGRASNLDTIIHRRAAQDSCHTYYDLLRGFMGCVGQMGLARTETLAT